MMIVYTSCILRRSSNTQKDELSDVAHKEIVETQLYEDPEKIQVASQGNYELELTSCTAYESTKQQPYSAESQPSSTHYEM